MKTRKWILILCMFILACALTACFNKHNAYVDESKVITKDKIISYITNELQNKYDKSFSVKLINKEQVKIPSAVAPDGSGMFYYNVKGAYRYKFEITDSNGVIASVTYIDPYYIDNKNKYIEEYFRDDYLEASTKKSLENEMESILKNYTSNYKMERDVNDHQGYDIFIYSLDSSQVKDIINGLDNCICNYRNNNDNYSAYSLYIIKDKKLYDSINYSILSKKDFSYGGKSHPTIVLPRLTGCAATSITYNEGYDDNIFVNNGDANDDEYQDIGKFKYIVFCYTSEPNKIIRHDQSFEVFGLL